MVIKFFTFEDKILDMRNKNCSISILLREAIKWSPEIDEQLVLCACLSILQKHNLSTTKNEVRKAFTKNYRKEFHGEIKNYLEWIYKTFGVGKQSNISKGEKSNKQHTRDFNKKSSKSMEVLK